MGLQAVLSVLGERRSVLRSVVPQRDQDEGGDGDGFNKVIKEKMKTLKTQALGHRRLCVCV